MISLGLHQSDSNVAFRYLSQVVDTKSGLCVGSASVSTARLLREDDMKLDEPLALKGTNNAKLMLTLQLRVSSLPLSPNSKQCPSAVLHHGRVKARDEPSWRAY